jgi:hypothetical protein
MKSTSNTGQCQEVIDDLHFNFGCFLAEAPPGLHLLSPKEVWVEVPAADASAYTSDGKLGIPLS